MFSLAKLYNTSPLKCLILSKSSRKVHSITPHKHFFNLQLVRAAVSCYSYKRIFTVSRLQKNLASSFTHLHPNPNFVVHIFVKFWRKIYNKGFHVYFDKTSSLFFLKLQYSIKRFFLAQKTLPVPQMNRLKQFCELFSFSVKIFDYKVQKLRICVCDMGVW